MADESPPPRPKKQKKIRFPEPLTLSYNNVLYALPHGRILRYYRENSLAIADEKYNEVLVSGWSKAWPGSSSQAVSAPWISGLKENEITLNLRSILVLEDHGWEYVDGGYALSASAQNWWLISFQQAPYTFHVIPSQLLNAMVHRLEKPCKRAVRPAPEEPDPESTEPEKARASQISTLTGPLRPHMGDNIVFNPDVLGYAHASSTLQRSAPDPSPSSKCSICLSRSARNAFIPCGHLAICDTCALAIYNQERDSYLRNGETQAYSLKCVICRRASSGIYRVYGVLGEPATKRAKLADGTMLQDGSDDGE